jgi:hypothetical protein
MQTEFAVDVLTILADPTRLDLYRFLVRQGPLGISADNIVSTLELAPTALVEPMALLERASGDRRPDQAADSLVSRRWASRVPRQPGTAQNAALSRPLPSW